ncbi:MAG: hypothetical protein SFW36_16970 [Leptolyngbyaceae cyanobacterium bins.59]|nr:hypothetical protein [Leptolyngbyaceae cyanobacterium bins.59]
MVRHQWALKLPLLSGLFGFLGFSLTMATVLVASPTAFLDQSFSCPPNTGEIKNFQMRGVYHWSQGVVVLYSATCGNVAKNKPAQKIFGHKVIKRSRHGWGPSTTDVYATKPYADPDQLVEYSIGKSVRGSDRHVSVYGQALSSRVLAIEVTFDNGKIIRKPVLNDVFAIVAPDASGACELRVFGSDNQMMKRYDLSPLYQWSHSHPQWAAQCLPFTLQL